MFYLEYIQTLGRRSIFAGSRRPDPLRTSAPAQSALGRHDTPLPELLQDRRLDRLPGAVTLVALRAAVRVAGANHRVVDDPRLRRDPPRQRAVTFVRGDARARLGVIAALAAAHVTAAASVRGCTYAATQSSTCDHRGNNHPLDHVQLFFHARDAPS